MAPQHTTIHVHGASYLGSFPMFVVQPAPPGGV